MDSILFFLLLGAEKEEAAVHHIMFAADKNVESETLSEGKLKVMLF